MGVEVITTVETVDGTGDKASKGDGERESRMRDSWGRNVRKAEPEQKVALNYPCTVYPMRRWLERSHISDTKSLLPYCCCRHHGQQVAFECDDTKGLGSRIEAQPFEDRLAPTEVLVIDSPMLYTRVNDPCHACCSPLDVPQQKLMTRTPSLCRREHLGYFPEHGMCYCTIGNRPLCGEQRS